MSNFRRKVIQKSIEYFEGGSYMMGKYLAGLGNSEPFS